MLSEPKSADLSLLYNAGGVAAATLGGTFAFGIAEVAGGVAGGEVEAYEDAPVLG